MEAQQEFDALVEKYGAEAVITAIKGHKKPITDAGTGCTNSSECGKGYYCDNGSCVLNVGP